MANLLCKEGYLSNDWGYIAGSMSTNQLGAYGTRNKTSLASVPGARAYGVAWMDDSNNYWMYGGTGYAQTNTQGKLSDVWMYDTTRQLWTWKSGSNVVGESVTLPSPGVTSVNIYPTGRIRTFFWHDKAQKTIYIFGGMLDSTDIRTNDMWKFNYNTLEWTFIGGITATSDKGSSIWPSARYLGAQWIDKDGTLWMFGGWGVLPDGTQWWLNDLWSYSPNTNMWTNMNAANAPVARQSGYSIYDPRDDSLYLFGGSFAASQFCNDVQQYNKTLNSWQYLGFGDCGSWKLSYGNKGEFSATNIPGARSIGTGFYYAGFLFAFSGWGSRGTPTQYRTQLEDIWAFDTTLRQWAWISGNSTYPLAVPTQYTALGEYTFNTPSIGGREGFLVASNGRNVYAFGGTNTYGLYWSDLWHARIYRDECSAGVADCSPLSTCVDEDNDYSCQCFSGYSGDGHGLEGCADIDECSISNDCNEHATCANNAGNFTCSCSDGFSGSGHGTEGCVDVDECALALSNCTGVAFCNNTIGGYTCLCPNNYTSDGFGGCTEIIVPQQSAPSGSVIVEPVIEDTPAGEAESNVLGIAVGVSIGGAAAVAAGVLLLFFMRRKKKRGVKIEDAMKTLDSDDDRFNIPYGELAFKRELGAGSFGKVFLGTWRKAEVALKLATLSTWEDFANEVKLTVNMPPHPNVVQVFGISRDGPHPVLILEFCDGGSLDKMLYDDNYSLSTEQTLEIVTGIARGMYHLHRNSIIHRDLAARNILLASGRPKISDFGLARVVDKQSQSGQTKSNIGPLRWMAPESLQSSTYSTQSDVWSFGIVVYEIVARHEPHFDEDPMSIGFRIRDEGLVPTIPETCDPFIRDLMLACWHPEPAKRPTFDQICELIKSKQAGDTGVKFVPSVTPSTGSSNESTLTAYSSMPASTHTVN